MKSLRASLIEQVYLLTLNNNFNNKFTYNKYKRCYKSMASIISIGKSEYSIIFPKPPVIFANTVFAGVEWNNSEYKFISPLQLYQEDFLKSNIILE